MSSKGGKHGKVTKSPSKGADKKKEIEAANIAKRKKEEFEVDPKKTLKYQDWEQTDTDVTVTLFAGKKLSSNEIDVEFREKEVRISLTDGRRWFCRFCEDIDMISSKVQLSKMKVLLKVKKLQPGVTWPSLQFDPEVSPSTASTEKVTLPLKASSSPLKSSDRTKLPLRTTTSSLPKDVSAPMDTVPKTTSVLTSQNVPKPIITKTNTTGSSPQPVNSSEQNPSETVKCDTEKMSDANTDQQEKLDVGSTRGATVSSATKAENISVEMKDAGLPKTSSKTEDNTSENVYDLTHVKHDFYEKTTDTVTAVIYVKQIYKDSIQVTFGKRDFCVKFKTRDFKFHSFHPGTNENTLFQWNVKVVDDVVKDSCKYKLTLTGIELTLVKEDPRKWGALEASQARSARVAPNTTSTWQSASKTQDSKETLTKESTSTKDDLQGVQTQGEAPAKVLKENWNERENKPSGSGLGSRSTILGDSNKDNVAQKPTCMVSPLKTGSDAGSSYYLGLTGLDNLGNTCFMNSVLQVLANTKELRDYFLGGVFQTEINHDNPLGTGGKMAVAFATLMKLLWMGKYRSYAPTKLKNLVGMKNSQFMGFAQHDAQEFLAFLLDGLHEDINRVKKKPYTQDVDYDGRPDEVVADEAWQRHKLRNDSFIVDLFQGQYKSKLVCPACGEVSITFDPFMHLSVPLPKKKNRILPVIFMSRDPYKKPVRYILRIQKDAAVDDLKDIMYKKTGVNPSCQRVFESYKHKVNFIYFRGTGLSNFNPADKILYVCEILSEKMAGEHVYEIICHQRTLFPVSNVLKCSNCKRESHPGQKLKRCTRCLKTAYCDQACQKRDWDRHKPMCFINNEIVGQPFIISIPKSQCTYSHLVQTLEGFSRYSLDVFQPPVSTQNLGSSTSVSSTNATPSDSPIPSTSTSDCTRTPSNTSTLSNLTNFPSTSGSDMTGQFSSQISNESLNADCSSQGTSTTEVASVTSSSEGSFITVGSVDENSCQSDSLVGLRNQNNYNAHEISESDSLDSQSLIPNGGSDSNDGNVGSCIGRDMSEDSLSDLPAGTSTTTPPTGFVLGRQQNVIERKEPPFSMRPCTKDCKLLPDKKSHKLEDKGDEPLDLTDIYDIAMDWKNSEKCVPYVMVQSKDIEYEEDESVRSTPAEESGNITLDQCLSLFTEPEVLSPDHAWYCPKCKEHREATKQLSIWRLPAYLIIQLKRFSFSSFIWRDKIDKMVEYPARGFDLSKHFIGPLPSSEPHPIYDLYGVVNHMGGILGGHYTSHARCPNAYDWKKNENDWRLFDDSMVSESSENHVVTRAGYVLFYKRRNMTISIPSTLEAEPKNVDTEIGTETEETTNETEKSSCQESPSTSDNRFVGTQLDDDDDHDTDAPVGSSDDNRLAYSGSGTSSSPSTYSFTDMDTVD